ncbi:MAG TPA: NADH-quinone oxidoreductase subunit L [Terriglobia bacterium]|nr:NADH-quinone oxidoreductase subunit L [Terriglobia bacterium]
MDFLQTLWLIPALPLVGAIVNGVAGKRLGKSLVGVIGAGTVALAFLLSAGAFLQMVERGAVTTTYFTWIQSGNFHAEYGFLLDRLSGVMILVVTGVGFLIHVYSIGYMHDDDGFYRYFAYLNLFMFAMLTLVLANNYILMFVGWEGVGLCSYLLIGFWFKRKSAGDAGKKAFIVNRVGDFGFLIAALLIFKTFGTLDYKPVFEAVASRAVEPLGAIGVLTAIGLLMFVGATGKSAQIPLYVWLPDAMEGPTPVSALIHAATMVTAGVYMVARSAVIFDHAPGAQLVVAAIGAATAIMAASIGLVQTDIKKVLAYSTVSQLGYMFLACGVGAYTAGVFHLMTHAFFKALLFLGAGSVIHGMGGIQDIRKMGGLRKQMPWTFVTFLAGTLAIAGIPGLAGFFSKDLILWSAWKGEHYGHVLWAVGFIAAGFTSFYMFRLLILTFMGEPRYTHHDVHHVHESPATMLIPLIILAAFAVGAGYIKVPAFLVPAFLGAEAHEAAEHGGAQMETVLMAASVAVAFAGLGLAWLFYVARPELPGKLTSRFNAMYTILTHKYYVDEIYDAVIVWPIVGIARDVLWKLIDVSIIDGSVNDMGKLTSAAAGGLRRMQSGYVRSYAAWIVLGGIVVVVWFLS